MLLSRIPATGQYTHPHKWWRYRDLAFSFLGHSPVGFHIDPLAGTSVHIDASKYKLEAVLVQTNWIASKEKVVAYASRTLTKQSQNYFANERECLAIVWAVTNLCLSFYGRILKILMDHFTLSWLTSTINIPGHLWRWVLRLREHEFAVVHKSDRKHSEVNDLSRYPLPVKPHDSSVVAEAIMALCFLIHSL